MRFVQDYAVALDAACRTVACAQGTHVSYDVLSLDIGSVPNNGSIEDAERVGFPVKPVDRLLAGVEAVVATARSGHLDIAIVGAGAGGVELCLALDYRVRREAGAARFFLLTASSSVLPGYSERVRRRVMHVLRQRGITVRVGRHVVAAYDHGVVLDDGERIAANPVIWVTGPAPAAWLRDCGLALDAEGFVLVNDRLQSTSHADVFAAGDVATMVDHPRPKSGVYAVRQGPPLAANLRAALRGAPLMLIPAAAACAAADHHGRAVRHCRVGRARFRGPLGLALEGLDRSAFRRPLLIN